MNTIKYTFATALLFCTVGTLNGMMILQNPETMPLPEEGERIIFDGLEVPQNSNGQCQASQNADGMRLLMYIMHPEWASQDDKNTMSVPSTTLATAHILPPPIYISNGTHSAAAAHGCALPPLDLSKIRYYDEPTEKSVCKEAQGYFQEVQAKNHGGATTAIVFDVDNTLIYHNRANARVYVKELFRFVRDTLGCLIFIITARRASGYDYTVEQLSAAGYSGYAKLICMPDDCYNTFPSPVDAKGYDHDAIELVINPIIGKWKESIRNAIAHGDYTDGNECIILGTVDDAKDNLKGDNVGHAVHIPPPRL